MAKDCCKAIAIDCCYALPFSRIARQWIDRDKTECSINKYASSLLSITISVHLHTPAGDAVGGSDSLRNTHTIKQPGDAMCDGCVGAQIEDEGRHMEDRPIMIAAM